MISSILLVIILISTLIIIHEFGHLLAAKLSHIQVEVFSVGFGPILLRRRIGETEYRLSAIPLGGFIKMAGEDEKAGPAPQAAPPPGGYSDKPLGIRIAVIAAGPVSNLVLGFLLLYITFQFFGASYMKPVLNPSRTGPAFTAGVRPGDLLLQVDNDTITSYDAFEDRLGRSAGRQLNLTVARAGSISTISYQVPGDTWYGASGSGAVVAGVKPGTPAARLGLAPGDTITALAGEDVTGHADIVRLVRDRAGQRLPISWHRAGTEFGDSVTPELGTDRRTALLGVLVEPPARAIDALIAPVVGRVRKGGPGAKLGLLPGDTLLSVAGTPVVSWDDFVRLTSVHPGDRVAVAWSRAGQVRTDSVTLLSETDQLSGERIGQLGVWVELPKLRLSVPTACWQAVKRTGYVTVQTFVIIYKVITRQLTARAIGGPVFVAKVAYEGAGWGAEYFLALWALLSINLFVVNLLPIPVMDGGRIALDLFAAIRRRPLSDKEMNWAANIGWVIVGLIFAFALFNDIVRLFKK